MNFKPLGERVLVKRDEVQETSAGGLLLTSSAKEKPQAGIIVAVGEGRYADDGKLIPVPVAVGDRVAFAKYAGAEINIQGVDYLLMSVGDLLGVYTA